MFFSLQCCVDKCGNLTRTSWYTIIWYTRRATIGRFIAVTLKNCFQSWRQQCVFVSRPIGRRLWRVRAIFPAAKWVQTISVLRFEDDVLLELVWSYREEVFRFLSKVTCLIRKTSFLTRTPTELAFLSRVRYLELPATPLEVGFSVREWVSACVCVCVYVCIRWRPYFHT